MSGLWSLDQADQLTKVLASWALQLLGGLALGPKNRASPRIRLNFESLWSAAEQLLGLG